MFVLEDGAAEEWTRANPLQQQRADRVLGQVIAWVEEGQRPEQGELPEGDPELLTYYGLFGRLQIDERRGLIYEGGGQGQVCLPSEYFEKVFKWAHQQPPGGHFGITATKKKFRERFYALGAGRRIVQEITNCINCIQKLNTVRKDQHVFHRMLETKPGSRLYIDLVGPLPENEYRGQRVSYMLTMMDEFTKWAEAIPVGKITARSVAKVVLEQWVARYRIPDQIHSDQGLQFTSQLFRGLMGLLGITRTTTPVYNPRSNKVERLHQVLGNVLRSDQTGSVYQWVQKVPLAMFAYRTTVSNVTGGDPFQGRGG